MFFKSEAGKACPDNRLNSQQQQIVNQLGLQQGMFVMFNGNELTGYGSTLDQAMSQSIAFMAAKGLKPNNMTSLQLGVGLKMALYTPFIKRDDHDPTAPGQSI